MFEKLKLGDKVAMPAGNFGDAQRELLRQAGEFASKQNPPWQFQADGYPGSVGYLGANASMGQYWLERIR